MVSSVRAQVKHGTTPDELLRALFPCGSVTGAPKIRAIEIIRSLEESPRGVYCGAIGYFAPDGSAAFNVAIRTITITGGSGELGIGSAVVHDSRAEDEYRECLLKARYLTDAQPPLQLIETLRWSPQDGFARLERHLRRLLYSAAALGLPCDTDAIRRAIGHAAQGSNALRIRLTVLESGEIDITAAPIMDSLTPWRFMLAEERTFSGDVLLQHKTSWRDLYEREYTRAIASGHDEVLFRNERDELTEGTRSNIFVQTSDGMLTPHRSCGLLPGCLREEMLENGRCREAVLYVGDLAEAKAIYFGNSVRGLVPATGETAAP
jgi:para-aminobenzoate synthetase/4-amino-4-deoxychorismate lyase